MNKQPQAIIFDFDGTIADTYVEGLRVIYGIAHHQPLPKEDVSRLRGMTLFRLLRQLRVPFWQMPFLLGRLRRAMRGRMGCVTPFSGAEEAIKDLSEEYTIFVQSSNSTKNVQLCLQEFGLAQYVTAIYGNVGVFAKARNLRRILHEQGLSVNHVWYVGDEPRDIRAAKQAHLKSVAVTWGFSNIRRLKRARPDALVSSTDELVRCFSNNYEK